MAKGERVVKGKGKEMGKGFQQAVGQQNNAQVLGFSVSEYNWI